MSTLPERVKNAILVALKQPTSSIVLHEPRFTEYEKEFVSECISSTFVSSVGSFVDRFEKELAEYTGAQYAVAVVNGTAALHVAMLLSGVEQGQEVIMPALTFVATANAARYLGAHPHFADSAESTLGLDPTALRDWLNYSAERVAGVTRNKNTGRHIHALVPMHTFGHPCDLDEMLAIAHDYKLVLIEDAAESLGSCYKGIHTGTIGKLGILSFNGNKIITTGGGGAILTNDKTLADRAKHITTTAKIPHRWEYEHDTVGFNYRMPNLNASLGCAQLHKLSGFLESKRRLLLAYKNAFAEISDIRLMEEPDHCHSNYWLQTIILNESVANQKNLILEATNNAGLMTRPAWTLIHRLNPYADCQRAPLPVAESLYERIINIPSSADLV